LHAAQRLNFSLLRKNCAQKATRGHRHPRIGNNSHQCRMLGRPCTVQDVCIWIQISEKFKMKAENTAKIPKYSIKIRSCVWWLFSFM
jgi:hypothetical protein